MYPCEREARSFSSVSLCLLFSVSLPCASLHSLLNSFFLRLSVSLESYSQVSPYLSAFVVALLVRRAPGSSVPPHASLHLLPSFLLFSYYLLFSSSLSLSFTGELPVPLFLMLHFISRPPRVLPLLPLLLLLAPLHLFLHPTLSLTLPPTQDTRVRSNNLAMLRDPCLPRLDREEEEEESRRVPPQVPEQNHHHHFIHQPHTPQHHPLLLVHHPHHQPFRPLQPRRSLCWKSELHNSNNSSPWPPQLRL